MNLDEISEDIIRQVTHNIDCGKDERFATLEIKSIIQKKIVDVLEPEGVYEKGKHYDGLGKYIGVVDSYPYGADYFRREHKFVQEPNKETTGGKVSAVNTILIREIKK